MHNPKAYAFSYVHLLLNYFFDVDFFWGEESGDGVSSNFGKELF
jgi:hypothetical protein